jgi:hypothetical protein
VQGEDPAPVDLQWLRHQEAQPIPKRVRRGGRILGENSYWLKGRLQCLPRVPIGFGTLASVKWSGSAWQGDEAVESGPWRGEGGRSVWEVAECRDGRPGGLRMESGEAQSRSTVGLSVAFRKTQRVQRGKQAQVQGCWSRGALGSGSLRGPEWGDPRRLSGHV